MAFNMKGGTEPNSEINVTPLIDVLLVLLIIFIIATPRTIHEISLNLPSRTETQQPRDDDRPQQLMVAVYEDRSIALNRELMDETALLQRLTAELRARESKVVFVDAHPLVSYDRVVTIMDLVRQAGPDKVGLARLKDDGPAEPTDPDAPADDEAPAEVE